MKKASNLRSQEDIKLLKIATENNSFFKLTAEKFGPEVHGLMCHDLEYQNLSVNQVLFEVGKLYLFLWFTWTHYRIYGNNILYHTQRKGFSANSYSSYK